MRSGRSVGLPLADRPAGPRNVHREPTTPYGSRLFIGGAFTPSLADAEQKVGEPIPADCRIGLYWVATPVHS